MPVYQGRQGLFLAGGGQKEGQAWGGLPRPTLVEPDGQGGGLARGPADRVSRAADRLAI